MTKFLRWNSSLQRLVKSMAGKEPANADEKAIGACEISVSYYSTLNGHLGSKTRTFVCTILKGSSCYTAYTHGTDTQ